MASTKATCGRRKRPFKRTRRAIAMRKARQRKMNALALEEVAIKIEPGKTLKHHAVPVVLLGDGKGLDPENSDDEFAGCDSESDPEIMEVKKLSSELFASSSNRRVKIKDEPMDAMPIIKQEPPPAEPETGRRPSRRAAQEAAKKIYNSVRQFSISGDAASSRMSSAQNSQYVSKILPSHTRGQSGRGAAKKARSKEWSMVRAPQADIDLIMECHEELLSAAQAEALLTAQLEYNMVMKTLRALKANNVRIICTLGDEAEPEKVSPAKNSTSGPNIVTLTPAQSSAGLEVVPVQLSAVSSPPSSADAEECPAQVISPTISVSASEDIIT